MIGGIDDKYLKIEIIEHEGKVLLHGHKDQFGLFGYELVYVLDGKGVHLIENERQKIRRGSYMFIDTAVSHGYEVAPGERLVLINFIFDFRAVDLPMGERVSLAEIACGFGINPSLRDREIRYDYIFEDDSGRIGELFNCAMEEMKSLAAGYRQIVKGALFEILIRGFRQYFARGENTKLSPETQFLVGKVNENYMLSTTLSDYAAKLGESVSKLSLRFKREMGIGFLDYLHKKRISEASRLIAMNDDSIEMIAERVGYSDAKKFRERFKSITGLSPREYRRSSKG